MYSKVRAFEGGPVPRKGRRHQQDPLRRVVQGILNLLLGALATWLAARITDWILGPVEGPEEEA